MLTSLHYFTWFVDESRVDTKTSSLQDEIIKELMSTEHKEKEDTTETDNFNKTVEILEEKSGESDNEGIKLHIPESDDGEEVVENFQGSPLVQKMKRCKEGNGDVNCTRGCSSTEDLTDFHHPPKRKDSIVLCERYDSKERKLFNSEDDVHEKIVMTRQDFTVKCTEKPEMKACSVTICDKCTPCKEAQGIRVSESDKEVISRGANRTLNFTSAVSRKSLFETPVGSRTWSVTENTTPDLFDTSTATEEYSMNLSQHRSLIKEIGSKYSGSSSKLFSDEDQFSGSGERKQYDRNTSDDRDGLSDTNDGVVEKLEDGVNSGWNFKVTQIEKDDEENIEHSPSRLETANNIDDSTTGGVDSDGVMLLTQEEIAALPKSRSPSPVFCSQANQAHGDIKNTYIDQSIVKEEKENIRTNNCEK